MLEFLRQAQHPHWPQLPRKRGRMPPTALPSETFSARRRRSLAYSLHSSCMRANIILNRLARPFHSHVTDSQLRTRTLLREICVLPFLLSHSCKILTWGTSKSHLTLRPGLIYGHFHESALHSEANIASHCNTYFRSAHVSPPAFTERPTSSLRSSTFQTSVVSPHTMAPAAHISTDSENRQLENVCTLPVHISEKKISMLPQKHRRQFTHLQSSTQIPGLREAVSKRRGALVVVEGLDRSGKSTQCEQLVDYLKSQGKQVQHIKFPDRSTATGKSLDAYLKNALDLGDLAVHKIFFQNRLEKMEEMEAALLEGVTLIVDRYSYSGVAFSAAKGLDVEWCKKIETPLPAPDLVLYLNIPVEVAAQRGAYGEERYEKMEFQRKVGQQFAMLRDASWKDVDATENMDSVQNTMRQLVDEVVGKCLGGVTPLERMWPTVIDHESKKENFSYDT